MSAIFRRAAAPVAPFPRSAFASLAVLAAVICLPLRAAEEIPRHYGRDRLVDIEHVRIDLEVDLVGRSVEGATDVSVRAMNDGTTRAELMAEDFSIRRVLVDGHVVAHEYDGRTISVPFEPALIEDDRRIIRVEYSAHPEAGLYFVGDPRDPSSLQCWSQGEQEENHAWFPVHDDPAERTSSETLVTVAPGYSVVSNGRLLDIVERPDGRLTFHHRLDFQHVPYLVSIAVGDWITTRDTWEGIELTYHVPRGKAADAARSLGRTPEILAFLSRETGVKYPYPAYRQVAVSDFIYGGMENIAATTLTDDTLHPERAHRDSPSDSLVAHEAAHQWFGDYVTCRDWSDTWLNEGFATYYAALTLGHLEGPDQLVVELDGMRKGAIEADASTRRPVVTNRYRHSSELFDGHAYSKGGMILHALRRELGDGPYRRSITAWLRDHAGQSADTQDFEQTIERVTGRDVSRFFAQWIHGAGEPDLLVSWTWKDGDCAVTIKQRQATTDLVGIFDVPLDVEILGDGWHEHREIRSTEAEATWHFAAKERPKAVLVDPQGWLLRKLEIDREREETLWTLAHASFLLARMEAARELADEAGQPKVLDALVAATRADAPWPLRRAAVESLAKGGSDAARDALLAVLGSEADSRVRRAAAKALGRFEEPVVVAALERALAADASWAVQADAATALGAMDLPGLDRPLEAALGRRSHREDVFGAALAALRVRRSPRARVLALEWSKAGRPRRARTAAISQLGEIAAREPDEKRRGEIREHLEKLLRDPHVRVRGASIDALVKSRDRAALPALQGLASSSPSPLTRSHAGRGVADLEKASAADARIEDLQRELDEERRERQKLDDRLRKLEARAPGVEEAEGGGAGE